MAFTVKNPSIDIGETSLENIFINNYMAMADEIQLKVYILGLSMARKQSANSNSDILSLLKITENELKEAWLFWKKMGLVDFDLPSTEDINFDIHFLSLREKYITTNFTPLATERDKVKKVLHDTDIKELFERAERIMNQPISADNRIKIIEWLTEFNIGKELLLKALKITYVERPPQKPSLKYVRGILSKWHKNHVKSLKQADDYEAMYVKKSELYREINYRLTSSTSIPTEAQIEIIEKWMKKIANKELFFSIIDFCSTYYKYSTYKRLDSLCEKIEKDFSLSLKGINEYIEKSSKKQGVTYQSEKIKSKQNFRQTTYQSMTKEDAIKTMKRNNPALLYNAKKDGMRNDK